MPQLASPTNANELEQAFASFNQVSRDLIDSYQHLEQRMSLLADAQRATRTATRLRRVLEALPAGVIVIDAAGVITEHNPAAVELLGMPLTGTAWRDVIERCFAPREDDGPDISLRDGRRVHLSTTPLGDEPGQIVQVTDVTRTRTLQDRLHRYEKLSSLGDMAAGLAHQLRTPLSSAVLYLGMLKSERSGIDRAAIVGKTLAQLQHIERLIRDMLAMSRVDLTQGETLTGTEVLTRLATHVAPLIPPRIELKLADDGRGSRVRVHAELLLSALSNLVNNAVQAIDDAGVITIGLRAGDDELAIAISDTGRGMSEETQRRIGQPFFTTRDGGTGLGVAVVHAVAQAHQGNLTFTSRAGMGSTFTVRLPRIHIPES